MRFTRFLATALCAALVLPALVLFAFAVPALGQSADAAKQAVDAFCSNKDVLYQLAAAGLAIPFVASLLANLRNHMPPGLVAIVDAFALNFVKAVIAAKKTAPLLALLTLLPILAACAGGAAGAGAAAGALGIVVSGVTAVDVTMAQAQPIAEMWCLTIPAQHALFLDVAKAKNASPTIIADEAKANAAANAFCASPPATVAGLLGTGVNIVNALNPSLLAVGLPPIAVPAIAAQTAAPVAAPAATPST